MPRQKPCFWTLRSTLAQRLAAAGYPVHERASREDPEKPIWRIDEVDADCMKLTAKYYAEHGRELPPSLRDLRDQIQRMEGGGRQW